jgi:transaldolase
MYVDNLIGPDTVNTLPESTMAAFEDHGTLARTIDVDLAASEHHMRALATVGVDMDDVGRTLEREGIAAFQASFTHVLGTLEAKSRAGSQVRSQSPSRG